ncbi:unnamed protein product [Arctia plantaginis]|uniref:Uncharacterized protein n=1 Tax=Arctia plantaginis TaxID=874455 RepID=A0A8S0YZI7_ARCPL|nr:unnamed protein product [Arctia plantaginis]
MISLLTPVVLLWAMCEAEDDYYYRPSNITRSTLSGIQAYRSALTLDWLAAEDMRQRELAAAFETEVPSPTRIISTDCIDYARPASGKIARLMLELLKNLEGDESPVMTDMIGALVRAKLLVETSMLDAEPDLDALVKTPGVMMGEPHTTFPRVLAMTWMTVTDPVTTKKFGWCPLQKVNQYLSATKSMDIAKNMRALEPIIARARFIMEEFIQHVTPLNMYEKKSTPTKPVARGKHYGVPRRATYPPRTPNVRTAQVLLVQSATTTTVTYHTEIQRQIRTEPETLPDIVDTDRIVLLTSFSAPILYSHRILLLSVMFII